VISAVLLLSALTTIIPGIVVAGGQTIPNTKPYALIFGTVFDPEGHTLYGVKVKIRRADEKKARWELYSNHTGEFAHRVPSRTWRLRCVGRRKGLQAARWQTPAAWA
jgi:hypothetical protein